MVERASCCCLADRSLVKDNGVAIMTWERSNEIMMLRSYTVSFMNWNYRISSFAVQMTQIVLNSFHLSDHQCILLNPFSCTNTNQISLIDRSVRNSSNTDNKNSIRGLQLHGIHRGGVSDGFSVC